MMTQPTTLPTTVSDSSAQSTTRNVGEALFSSKTSWALASLSGFLVILAVVMALYGAKPYDTSATPSHSYSGHLLGHRAWIEFLQQSQIHPLRVHSPQTLVTASSPVFFIEPLSELPKEFFLKELSSVLEQRLDAGRHSVVVLPKWKQWKPSKNVLAQPTYRRRGVGEIQADLRKILPQSIPSFRVIQRPMASGKTSSVSRWHNQEVSWNQTPSSTMTLQMLGGQTLALTDRSWRVWCGNRQHAWIASYTSSEGGMLVLVSDPDLIHNFNIHRADHAAVSWALIRDVLKTDTILVDEVYHHQIKQFSITEELGRFPRSLLIFHALILWMLLAWAGATRFGKIITLAQQRHHGPKEIIEITSWVWVCGSSPSRLASRYVQKVLDDLADRLGLGHIDSPQKFEQTDEMASRWSIRPEAMELYQRATGLEHQRGSALEALRIARRAWSFRHQMIHRNRP